jgi:hypothetical protein
MDLSATKTKVQSDVIQGSVKDDKLYWLLKNPEPEALHNHLLSIHQLSKDQVPEVV